MSTTIMDTITLSESLTTYIKTPKVKIIEELDKLILIPHEEENSSKCEISGMFKSDRSIVDEYIAEKRAEKRKDL
jgi:hypothetical protein